MAKTKDNEISVVAQNKVVWSGGEEIVLSFDKAWHRMIEKASEGLTPVSSTFMAFVRKPE